MSKKYLMGGTAEGAALRARIYKLAREVLKNEGVSFSVHNEGKHLIVDGRFDFWPGTNKWGKRDQGPSKRYRFGIIKLIRAVKGN